MEKKQYICPHVECVELQAHEMVLQASVNADGVGVKFGGNASKYDISDADVNADGGWEIW